MSRTGSPGIACARRKVTMLMPMRTGSICHRRCRTRLVFLKADRATTRLAGL
jgi:hypothetical protein